jgi:CheY-like chemotaxis protein
MTRILLVDDSPHAQRMGERILSDEGYEVVTVTNADSALIRLEDVDPDVVVADTVMPGRNGFDLCRYLKMSPRHRHVRVILTAGALESFDEEQARQVEADGSLKKPFEASALVSTVKPLAEAAVAGRPQNDASATGVKEQPGGPPLSAAPFVAVIDGEQIRAAVTIALDASMGSMVDEITKRVVSALAAKKPELHSEESMPAATASVSAVAKAVGVEEPQRPAKPARFRSGSILGLDVIQPESPESE